MSFPCRRCSGIDSAECARCEGTGVEPIAWLGNPYDAMFSIAKCDRCAKAIDGPADYFCDDPWKHTVRSSA